MLAPPPPRFSTTICWPQMSDSFPATTRAMASVPPPGGNGTMRRTCRAGQAWARARRAVSAATPVAATAATKRRRSIMRRLLSLVDPDLRLADHRAPLVHLGLDVAGELVRRRTD